MDRLYIFIILLLGVALCCPELTSGSVQEVNVRPGDTITLYCDCKPSNGVYIIWYRKCSHVNQPLLVLRTRYPHEELLDKDYIDVLNPFPRFRLVKNDSSQSYDLVIANISVSDKGFYYCGTEQPKVDEDKALIYHKYIYSYGNVTTRILFEPHCYENLQHCGFCWVLLISLSPALAVLSTLLFSILVYCLCKRPAKETPVDEERPETRDPMRENQGEDVCYAALEIHQISRKPRMTKTLSLDNSTYSAINTCRL